MFNLLPNQEKKLREREYRLRLVTVSLLLFGALGTIASVLLIPSFVVSSQKEKLAILENESLKKEIASRSQDNLSEILKVAGDQVKALDVGSRIPYGFELVSDVVSSKTFKIKLYGMDISRSEDAKRVVKLTGRASDREALLSFARILEKGTNFSRVDVPVSNFADESNIDFFISLNVK